MYIKDLRDKSSTCNTIIGHYINDEGSLVIKLDSGYWLIFDKFEIEPIMLDLTLPPLDLE